MSKKVSVTLSDELYEDATNFLCRHGLTLQEVIRNLLRAHTISEKQKRRKESEYWTNKFKVDRGI